MWKRGKRGEFVYTRAWKIRNSWWFCRDSKKLGVDLYIHGKNLRVDLYIQERLKMGKSWWVCYVVVKIVVRLYGQ